MKIEDRKALTAQFSLLKVASAVLGRSMAPHGVVLTVGCPFHRDDAESLWIDTRTDLFYWRVCDASGDVIMILRSYFNISELAAGRLRRRVAKIGADTPSIPDPKPACGHDEWAIGILLRLSQHPSAAGAPEPAPDSRESAPRLDPADQQGGRPWE